MMDLKSLEFHKEVDKILSEKNKNNFQNNVLKEADKIIKNSKIIILIDDPLKDVPSK